MDIISMTAATEAYRAEREKLHTAIDACHDEEPRTLARLIAIRGQLAGLKCIDDYTPAQKHFDRAWAVLRAASEAESHECCWPVCDICNGEIWRRERWDPK